MGAEMVHALLIWLLVAGFFGAGLYNAIVTPATQISLGGVSHAGGAVLLAGWR